MRHVALLVFIFTSLLELHHTSCDAALSLCPQIKHRFSTPENAATRTNVVFRNVAEGPAWVYWVNQEGAEVAMHELSAGKHMTMNSDFGTVYRVRHAKGHLLKEHKVVASTTSESIRRVDDGGADATKPLVMCPETGTKAAMHKLGTQDPQEAERLAEAHCEAHWECMRPRIVNMLQEPMALFFVDKARSCEMLMDTFRPMEMKQLRTYLGQQLTGRKHDGTLVLAYDGSEVRVENCLVSDRKPLEQIAPSALSSAENVHAMVQSLVTDMPADQALLRIRSAKQTMLDAFGDMETRLQKQLEAQADDGKCSAGNMECLQYQGTFLED